jgi:hypothetical protein
VAIRTPVFKHSTQTGGRSFRSQTIDLSPAAAVTVDGNSPNTEDVGGASCLRLTLDVTARTGTSPTLDVSLQHSDDGTTFRALGSFDQKTAVGAEKKTFGPCARFVRAVFDVGGTSPNFTFTVKGEAV